MCLLWGIRNIRDVYKRQTIDNDLYGTDSTIGYDTAVNTAVEAVDKIKDTASAHNRLFFVEVMGRDAGFIALRVAIATGAEAVLVLSLIHICCGICAKVCPTAAIEGDIPRSLAERCIKCCACVKECPLEARVFDTPYTAMLFEKFSTRREPECWI